MDTLNGFRNDGKSNGNYYKGFGDDRKENGNYYKVSEALGFRGLGFKGLRV